MKCGWKVIVNRTLNIAELETMTTSANRSICFHRKNAQENSSTWFAVKATNSSRPGNIPKDASETRKEQFSLKKMRSIHRNSPWKLHEHNLIHAFQQNEIQFVVYSNGIDWNCNYRFRLFVLLSMQRKAPKNILKRNMISENNHRRRYVAHLIEHKSLEFMTKIRSFGSINNYNRCLGF